MTETKISKLSKYHEAKNSRNSNLPWIKENNGQIVFWSVKPSGDYIKDCQKGREYAALALEHMKQSDFAPLLTWCIMDMPRKKDCSGIEIGFIEFFAELAVSKTSSDEPFSQLTNLDQTKRLKIYGN
jgi:hypothetical protein